MLDSADVRPGIGFSSKDGKQWIYVTLNAASHSIEAWQKLANGIPLSIKHYSTTNTASGPVWNIQPGVKYRLKLDWSTYSDGLIVFLQERRARPWPASER